jgi:hypothetical protein
MKTIAIEDIMADTIVSFCENAAELGCPRDQDVDMWFRYLAPEERFKIMDKLIEIQEREDEPEERDIVMKEITIDLEEDIIADLIKFARSKIVNDDQALINYGANLALRKIVETNR